MLHALPCKWRRASEQIKQNLLMSYKPFLHLAMSELTKPNVVNSQFNCSAGKLHGSS